MPLAKPSLLVPRWLKHHAQELQAEGVVLVLAPVLALAPLSGMLWLHACRQLMEAGA